MNSDFSVNDRANMVLLTKKVTVNSFARMSGMLQSTINPQFKSKNPMTLPTVMAILNVFPDVSADWLLRGTGNMLHTDGVVINNTNSHHNNTNTGSGSQVVGSDQSALLAEKDREIDELRRDKENLMTIIKNITTSH